MEDGQRVERWLPIEEAPTYEVSSMGRIRSLKSARGFRTNPRLLKPWVDKDGYLMVSLNLGELGKKIGRRISRLVLTAFVGLPPSDAHEAAHWNNDRADNRLENLRWATSVENKADMLRHGTVYRGERHSGTPLTESDVVTIKEQIAAGRRGVDIAADFGVVPTTISNIKYGRNWKHIQEADE